jgi:hypothetical protein
MAEPYLVEHMESPVVPLGVVYIFLKAQRKQHVFEGC